MRKFLLLFSFLMTFGLASASVYEGVVAFYANGATYNGDGNPQVTIPDGAFTSTANQAGTTFTAQDVCSINWTKKNSSNSNVTSGLIRWYANDILNIIPVAGVTITEVSIHVTSSSYGNKTLTASTGTVSYDATTMIYSWSGSETGTLTITPGVQIRPDYIEIAYTKDSSGDFVASPTIEMGENNTVILSSDDGDEIRYTIDGTEPTATSTLYTDPFTITEATTVKAVAIKNGTLSAVNTKTVYPNTLSSLGQFLSVAPSTEAKINTPLTAIYHCGRNLYLTDGTDCILAYNNSDLAAVSDLAAQNGDVISFISGTYKSQNGLPEIIPTAVGEKSAGTPVNPEELTLEEIGSDMLNKYVKISNVNITAAASANNYTATDETGSIIIYNSFYNATFYPDAITQPDGTTGNTVPEGEGFTVYGFVSCYNTTLQITPIKFEGGTVMETVATPVFTPASGSELSVGDEITIDCDTEDATIYVTFNGEDPTADSEEYTTPIVFSEACTIKAIAIKNGMINSDVATATYTLKVEGSATAMFDFTKTGNITSLTETALEAKSAQSTTNNLSNVVFTNGPVTLQFAKGEATADPRWYIESMDYDVRMYKNNAATISLCEDGYRIESITFAQISGSTSWATSWTVTPSDGTWNSKTWTAPENSVVNNVEFIPGTASRVATIEVKYVEDENGVSGIGEIKIDNANAPVEYFNLQGIRVNSDNLTPGIYIRRQGTQVVKVLVK